MPQMQGIIAGGGGVADLELVAGTETPLGLLPVIVVDSAGATLTGQAVKADSIPVVIASDQGDIPITLDGETVPISAASLPLPTGAATAANQTTGNGQLTNVNVRLGEVDASPTANTVLARLKDLLTGIVLAAGNNLIGKVQPFAAMLEGGLTELVGIDEQVDNGDLGGSVGVALGGTYSGEILSFAFYATEDGSGAVQDSAGRLLILDADPATTAGDTDLAAVEWPTVLGMVQVEASDWIVDANGGMAYITDTPVAFHPLSTLYFVWLHEDATSLNDAAGDDEQLEFNFWYRRDS